MNINLIRRYKTTLIKGDSTAIIELLPENFFQTIITSPPYWGLRDYEIKGQIGLEDNLDDYIAKIVLVFNGLHKALKADGVLWLNIGDCYTSGNRTYRAGDKKNPNRGMDFRAKTPDGLKSKDLIGLPWLVAFALQKNGWYLRSEVIWKKTNPMPESVKDRPSRSHEHLFLFSKSEHYKFEKEQLKYPDGKQMGTVWEFSTENKKKFHSAVFPGELITPCILSSTREGEYILDPFSGSSTVGVECLKSNRRYVGIEISKKYIKSSLNYLPKAKLLTENDLILKSEKKKTKKILKRK